MTEDTQNFEALLDTMEDEKETEQVETTSEESQETDDTIIDSSETTETTTPQDEASDGETEITEQEQTTEDEFEFPQDWSEERKTLFAGLNAEQKADILNINKGFQSDYTKKTQTLAEERKALESDAGFAKEIKGVFDDREKLYMQSNGIDEKQAVNMAVANWRMETQDPMQFINQVAQRNGIDLYQEATKLVQAHQELPPEQQQMNSIVQPLQQQVEALTRQIQDSQTTTATNLVDKYVNMADETGALKYPNFQAVEQRMINEIQTMGKNYMTLTQEDWDTAYNNSCYADPSIRANLLTKQAEVKQTAERKKTEALKALGAGKTVKSSAGAGNKQTAESFDDFIEEHG